ncbi:MAG: Bacterial extracellular solute-binding protein family 5 Middle [Chloroflexota bacterium]|nr:Bacterial extracellular solute-binding protein family 5 Middle [Chloroflexota bacterium]
MSTLQIDLMDSVNKRRLWVSLRDNLPIQDLIQKLVIDLELPQGVYDLTVEKTGKALPLDSTLKKEEIADGSQLRLRKKRKAAAVVPIPIIPGGKDSADRPPESSGKKPPKIPEEKPTGKPAEKPADKAQGRTPKGKKPPKSQPPKGKPVQEAYGPPIGTTHQTQKPDQKDNFWHRPFTQPPFLRWIPVSLWVYVRPIILIFIVLVMFVCYFFGLCVCRCQGTTDPDCPPAGSESSEEPGKEEEKVIQEEPPNEEAAPEAPPIIDNRPPDEVIFTYENRGLYEAYDSGNYTYETEKTWDNPGISDVTEALTRTEIPVVRIAPNDRPEEEQELVLISVNEAADPATGYAHMRFVDVESGVEYTGRVGNGVVEIFDEARPDEGWIAIDLLELRSYEPNEGCWHYTAYIALNPEESPLDNLDLRKALLYSLDAQSLLEMAGLNPTTVANTLIPTGTLLDENLDPQGIYGHVYDPELAQGYFQYAQTATSAFDPDFIEIFYCASCESMGNEVFLIIDNWASALGIDGQAISEPYEMHFTTPIKDSGRMLTYTAFGYSNVYSFYQYALESGSIMLPEEGEARLLEILQEYAYESDPQIKIQYVDEIERLILEEYAVAIPLYYYQSCY